MTVKGLLSIALIFLALADVALAITPLPVASFPTNSLTSKQLAVIVNDRDPLSKKIAAYYVKQRKIPAENVILIAFNANRNTLSEREFQRLKTQVDLKTPAHVQAYALTWAQPYRVECMSITAAFAFGFDRAYCAEPCKETKRSRYYGSASSKPFDDMKIRPTMALAATSFEQAQQLIDRGIAADGSLPQGHAWLLETADQARSVRKAFFATTKKAFGNMLPVHVKKSQGIKDKKAVMFYFTGLVDVPFIDTNQYLPGAVADHLTSSGGQLTDSKQMSALRWLEAGATGSYGTVVEPCAFPSKFPYPPGLMQHYLAGSTLIEAYWKSVQMPGQGIFIGEPLAKPYAGYQFSREGRELYLYAPIFATGSFAIYGADTKNDLYQPVKGIPMQHDDKMQIWLLRPQYKFYRVRRAPQRSLNSDETPSS